MLDYGAAYFQQRESDAYRRRVAYRLEYQRVIQRVNSGNLLDVGCGTGEFTDLFPTERWTRYGIEPDEYARKEASKRNVRLVTGWHDLTSEAFDLVIYRGTLQHIDEPFHSLRQAVRVLKPNGVLAILAQPDAWSLVYRIWHTLPALDPPRNWWVPNRWELQNILVNLGFYDLEFYWPYRGSPYARPVRDVARFILRLFGVRKPFAWPGNMLEVYARRGNG